MDEDKDKVRSFPPMIGEGARVLVLGSMPGAKSLQEQRYYANERNYLWRLLYGLRGLEPDEAYGDRLAYAAGQGIGLWDMIDHCHREGSLDMNIRNAVPNDLPGLAASYPSLQALAFNGSKSYEIYRKHFAGHPGLAHLDLLRLPSSSPIPTPAMRTLEDRLEKWRMLLPYLKE
ncbi:DNA-deoxyinosine glycosylase [Paenibacillus sp. D9]|uniref:DNA-deoxyinosine glycosylase n=1 Tax=Paenibacillus sp. D9 TaxID=665792 RepID=UPI00067641E8|nr:DNA-deoxyinosine glycosylase [Paenibacillus sp. D9]